MRPERRRKAGRPGLLQVVMPTGEIWTLSPRPVGALEIEEEGSVLLPVYHGRATRTIESVRNPTKPSQT